MVELLGSYFIKDCVQALACHASNFNQLANQLIQVPHFLQQWAKLHQTDASIQQPSVTRQEYLFNLIPAIITALTAVFGFLLGLSNFEKFKVLLGNWKIVTLSLTLTILFAVITANAIIKDLNARDLREKFTSWFYLRIVDKIINLIVHQTNEKHSIAVFESFFHQVNTKLLIADTPDIYALIKEIGLHEDIKLEKYFKKNFISSPHVFTRPTSILRKILDNRTLWETLVSNLAMTAGFVGVIAGTIKSASHFFGISVVEALISSTESAIFFLILISIIVTFNIYARLKGFRYQENRARLFLQQEEVITNLIKILNSISRP